MKKIVKYATNTGVHFSNTSKLGCSSWSLQAGETCPGAIVDGKVCGICSKCYAKKGRYRMDNVSKVRRQNWLDWQKAGFIDDFVKGLDRVEYFRWFDSGDIATRALALKILSIMLLTPNTKHWIPTKSYDVAGISDVIEMMESLPNVTVRRSAREFDTVITGKNTCSAHLKKSLAIGFDCPAYKNDGKCGVCRACWKKAIKNISYRIH